MNEFLTKNKIKLMILAISVVALVTSASYAWFTATVTGEGEQNVVRTGTMEITYTDGDLIGVPTNMIPGQTIEKRFKVKNTGTFETSYIIYLSEVINKFNPSSDLEYKLEKTSTNGYVTNGYVTAPVLSAAINNVAQTIAVNEEQEYKLTIHFKETDLNQDSNKGKKFQSKIQINEVNDATVAINLHSDVALSSSTITASIGRSLSNLFIPSNINYLFMGWYKDSNYEVAVTNETMVTEDLTDLYAKWETVSYDFAEYLRGLNTSDVTQDDGSGDHNMRFIGTNPRNYVNFKLSDGTYETWQVIGVFDSNTHKVDGDLVKIIRSNSIGTYAWDTSETNGRSNWVRPATLNSLLNGSTYKYKDSSYVENVTWKIGATYFYGSNTVTPYLLYQSERGDVRTTVGNYEVEWNGKVAVAYSSDYLLSTSGNASVSRETCYESAVFNSYANTVLWGRIGTDGIGSCSNNSWIVNKNLMIWSLSVVKEYIIRVGAVNPGSSYGILVDGITSSPYNILPSVYLKKGITCINCNQENAGTIGNPYELHVDE